MPLIKIALSERQNEMKLIKAENIDELKNKSFLIFIILDYI